MLARAVSIWRLEWAWRIHFQDGSFTCLLVGGLSSSFAGCWQMASVLHHLDLCIRLVECPSWHSSWLPQSGWSKRKSKEESTVFYDLVLEVIRSNFYHILFIKSESVSTAHTQGEGISLHLLKAWVSNNLWTYFKTTINCKHNVVIGQYPKEECLE